MPVVVVYSLLTTMQAVCIQVFYYYSNFPNDSKPLKAFVSVSLRSSAPRAHASFSPQVGLLWTFDTVHQILVFRYRTFTSTNGGGLILTWRSVYICVILMFGNEQGLVSTFIRKSVAGRLDVTDVTVFIVLIVVIVSTSLVYHSYS